MMAQQQIFELFDIAFNNRPPKSNGRQIFLMLPTKTLMGVYYNNGCKMVGSEVGSVKVDIYHLRFDLREAEEEDWILTSVVRL